MTAKDHDKQLYNNLKNGAEEDRGLAWWLRYLCSTREDLGSNPSF